jgi:hypothetical protein
MEPMCHPTRSRPTGPGRLLVVLPFLRPLPVVRSARARRLLRLVRVVAALSRAGQGVRRLLVRHKLHYALLGTIVVVFGSATLVYAVEADSGGNRGMLRS